MIRPAFHIDPPLAAIPASLRADGVDAFQTTLRNPQRFGKDSVPDAADQDAYRAGAAGLWGIAHATLLTNLASPEGRIRNASVSALVGDLQLAAQLGLVGVCFHVGYAKGHPTPEAALTAAARSSCGRAAASNSGRPASASGDGLLLTLDSRLSTLSP